MTFLLASSLKKRQALFVVSVHTNPGITDFYDQFYLNSEEKNVIWKDTEFLQVQQA